VLKYQPQPAARADRSPLGCSGSARRCVQDSTKHVLKAKGVKLPKTGLRDTSEEEHRYVNI